ncbi:MAG: threonylcarbamoyl-AMP synthase [Lachnospiraceae bacterium]|nr:threonylcarbamoyl-AMP synthase [Lachnospiraceae bacterium]
MDTIIKKVMDSPEDETVYEQASQIIREGGLVAFPTETVYGLGADGMNAEAAAKIYAAKGRPSDNPLILHIADKEGLAQITDKVPPKAEALMKAFWPGPLTMIFEKKKEVPYGTTGGLDTVAVRMPSHPVARALIRKSGTPIAAPSANTSGRPSPTKAEHVREDMNGKIDMLIDGGSVGIGLESTIMDMTVEPPMLLRPGYITREMLEQTIGEIRIDPSLMEGVGEGVKPKAPGMKYRHYAPKAELTIVEGELERVAEEINRLAQEKQEQGHSTGIIATEETKAFYKEAQVRVIGTRQDEETIARHLFAVLREFDESGTEYIFSEAFSEENLGQAIMNRLVKAAGHHIIRV